MLDKVQEDRLKKLSAIREMGIDPYGRRYDTAKPAAAVRAEYEKWEQQAGGHEAAKAKPDKPRGDAAGRIILMRDMGKMMFLTIRDESGTIQLAFRKRKEGADAAASVATLCDADWKLAGLLDLGDIIAAQGPLERTRTGEITIWCEKLTLLAKSLNPMPEKWHGLSDTEIRYRQRYLDLMANEDVKQVFLMRSEIIREIRDFLHARGFVEVETPMMQAIPGGAAAQPFVTHHKALGCDFYLRIALELYLKRLLVGGLERVFELGRNFRNEGLSRKHNPEFTMLEVYQAYGDFETMMELLQGMVCHLAENVLDTLTIEHKDASGNVLKTIDLTPPWRRVKYRELVIEKAGADWFQLSPQARRERAITLGAEIGKEYVDYEVTQAIFEKLIEPTLIQPTFVTHAPRELVPLAKLSPDDPTTAEVFECCINGQEIAPAYSEQNDPIEQRERLEHQAGGEQQKLDEDFLVALEHGMPPAGGMGIGIDRLCMMLLGQESIRDVILFPQLKPK